jgi:hypothetical protein
VKAGQYRRVTPRLPPVRTPRSVHAQGQQGDALMPPHDPNVGCTPQECEHRCRAFREARPPHSTGNSEQLVLCSSPASTARETG